MWDLTGYRWRHMKLFCSWGLDMPQCSPIVWTEIHKLSQWSMASQKPDLNAKLPGCVSTWEHGASSADPWHCSHCCNMWATSQTLSLPFEMSAWAYLIFHLVQTHKSKLVVSFGDKEIENYLLHSHIRNKLGISQIIELQFYLITASLSLSLLFYCFHIWFSAESWSKKYHWLIK